MFTLLCRWHLLPKICSRPDWEEKMEEMFNIRTLARERETTVGELVLGVARGALPPPHPDQWLPKADRKRHDDEVWTLCLD